VLKLKKLMKLLKIFKLLLVVPSFIGFVGVNAQSVEQNSKTNSTSAPTEARATNTVKGGHAAIAPKRKLAAPATSPAVTNSEESKTVLNENDPYMGRSQEILGRLTVKEIPSDFPKYSKGYGVKYYNDVMDNYYMTHPAIVQKWVTDKLNRKKN
jgi:hypothetical protein